jgi:hypothetical protein
VFVLLRPGLVAVATDEKTLRALDARREGGGKGLDGTPFGQRILEAYPNGVGLLFAADLERMTAAVAEHDPDPRQRLALRRSGLDGLRYLRPRAEAGCDENQTQAVLAFWRRAARIASGSLAPAPMGAPDFVSPARREPPFVFRPPRSCSTTSSA